MLASLPPIVVIIVLAILGALAGQFINWAIYSWAIFTRRPISPWMSLDDQERMQIGATAGVRRIPVLGWWAARGTDFGEHVTRNFWIRPMLMEGIWVLGLPWVYFWYAGGGLLGLTVSDLPTIASWDVLAETWFWSHTVLLALLFIATFIDFDEKMIPDQITVPGTVIGLLIAAAMPWSRLPEIGATAAGTVVSSIDFASPNPIAISHWSHDGWGLVTVIAIFTVWVLALLPRISPFHLGLGAGIKYTIASVIRPPRKNPCTIRIEHRRPFGITKILALIWIVGVGLLTAGWCLLPVDHWYSLLGAMIGLAVSGGLIWAIRIVGGLMMGQQAMGFGDVTLMAMVGTFIGWQASIAAFVCGIIIAMMAVIVMAVFIRDSYIAFGPYLSMGTVVAIFNWQNIWEGARLQVFAFGPSLLLVLLASLVGMVVLLPIVRWIKERIVGA
jgi:prepilin signal peptidase PulO-like enzyme (type II secretory pathway)